MSQEQANICQICCAPNSTLVCSRCYSARYCSAACQMSDWPEHKKACPELEHRLLFPQPPLPPCGNCGQPGKRRCSRCAAVRYCSAECQRKAWKKHKKVCSPDLEPSPAELTRAHAKGWATSGTLVAGTAAAAAPPAAAAPAAAAAAAPQTLAEEVLAQVRRLGHQDVDRSIEQARLKLTELSGVTLAWLELQVFLVGTDAAVASISLSKVNLVAVRQFPETLFVAWLSDDQTRFDLDFRHVVWSGDRGILDTPFTISVKLDSSPRLGIGCGAMASYRKLPIAPQVQTQFQDLQQLSVSERQQVYDEVDAKIRELQGDQVLALSQYLLHFAAGWLETFGEDGLCLSLLRATRREFKHKADAPLRTLARWQELTAPPLKQKQQKKKEKNKKKVKMSHVVCKFFSCWIVRDRSGSGTASSSSPPRPRAWCFFFGQELQPKR